MTSLRLAHISLILLVALSSVAGVSHKARGIECDKNGDLDCAIREFREGTIEEPGDARGFNNLGVALMRKNGAIGAGQTEEDREGLRQARQAFITSLSLAPDPSTEQNLKGLSQYMAQLGMLSVEEVAALGGEAKLHDGRKGKRQPKKGKTKPTANTPSPSFEANAGEQMQLDWNAGAYRAAISRCSSELVTVEVSSLEQEANKLSTESLLKAARALRVCGVTVLQNVFRPKLVEKLAKRQKAQFTTYLRKIQDDPSATNTTESSQRSPFRYELKLPLKAPFTNEELIRNPLLKPLLDNALGSRTEIDTFSSITSLPNAPPQHWHQDTGLLFEGFSHHTPAHGLIVVIPLVNISTTNGPTEFLLGSHVDCPSATKVERQIGAWRLRVCPHVGFEFAPGAQERTAILFDVRILHRGNANTSPDRRPILYVSYFREWYTDRVNFNDKQTRKFDQYVPEERKLLSRLDTLSYTQQLEQLLVEKGVDVKALQSQYRFDKHTLQDLPATA